MVPSECVKYPSAATSGSVFASSRGILCHVISSFDDPTTAPLGIFGIRISIGALRFVTSIPSEFSILMLTVINPSSRYSCLVLVLKPKSKVELLPLEASGTMTPMVSGWESLPA